MPIHPTAIVHPQAQIEESVEVGPYVVIDKGVRIGARTRVMPFAHINGETIIGEDNIIHVGAVIGHEPQHVAYDGAPRRLSIGNRNVIREYVSIHRAYEPEGSTTIGDGCFLMGFSHLGHDCHVGNGVILANGALLAGHVEVGDKTFISGNCVVHQFVRIGRNVMFQGLAGVGKDVPPFMMVSGVNNVSGLNTVGLRRAGFSAQARAEIKEAYKILFREGSSIPRALEKLETGGFGPEVQEIIDFVRKTKRGICSYRGRGGSSDE